MQRGTPRKVPKRDQTLNKLGIPFISELYNLTRCMTKLNQEHFLGDTVHKVLHNLAEPKNGWFNLPPIMKYSS